MTDTPCSVDPAHGRADYGTSYGPLCADCYRYRVARQVDNEGYRTTSLDGMLSPRFVEGLDANGERPEGAHSWEWRPCQRDPDDHHEEPFVINGELHFRQAPPVYSRLARLDSDPRQARYIGQNRRQRRALARALGKVTARGISVGLGVSLSAARRMVTQRNKGA